MSAERKPFAAVVEVEGGFEVYLDGQQMMPHSPRWPNRTLPEEIVAAYNAAVEAREAQLRGALVAVAQKHFDKWAAVALEDVLPGDRHQHRAMASVAAEIADEAKTVDGSDYVPAAEHAALKKHIEGTWGVLLQELAATEQWTPIAAALAAELGVKLDDYVVLKDTATAFGVAIADLEKLAEGGDNEIADGLRAAAKLLRDRVKYVPPPPSMQPLFTLPATGVRFISVVDAEGMRLDRHLSTVISGPVTVEVRRSGPRQYQYADSSGQRQEHFVYPVNALTERVNAQHLQVCDDVVRRYLSGADSDVQHTVEHPGGDVLVRDTYTDRHTQFVIETGRVDGHFRTTVTQQRAPLTP